MSKPRERDGKSRRLCSYDGRGKDGRTRTIDRDRREEIDRLHCARSATIAKMQLRFPDEFKNIEPDSVEMPEAAAEPSELFQSHE
jgi:hypothetical protein